MAQQTTVRFIDDLDGSEAAGTIIFGLGGRTYEIDLSDENADMLRDALAPYLEAARKGAGRGRAQRQTARGVEKPAQSSRDENAAIRQWAREHGHQISERGRISRSIVEAYRAAS